MIRLLAVRPWLIAGAVAVSVAGYLAAGVQTVRYHDAVADLRAAETRIVADHNDAQRAVIQALQANHARELQAREARIEAERRAVTSARDEYAELLMQVDTLQKELEDLHDVPIVHDYLSVPVPDAVRERVRAAQDRQQTGNR